MEVAPVVAAIGTSDQTIHVDALHFMAERARSDVTEIAGASHVGFIVNPKPYAEVILTAVKATT